MLPVLLATLAAAVPTADCSQHVEGGGATAEQRAAALRQSVRVGGTTFFGLRNARRHDFTEQHVWKAGLGVRAGAPLRIKVAVRDRSWLAVDYDRTDQSGKGAPEVRVIPCDPDTPRFSDDGVVGEETGYAGGFVAQRNGCGTLLLRRENARKWRRVRVAFGARCR
jgi:hypothetical protein